MTIFYVNLYQHVLLMQLQLDELIGGQGFALTQVAYKASMSSLQI